MVVLYYGVIDFFIGFTAGLKASLLALQDTVVAYNTTVFGVPISDHDVAARVIEVCARRISLRGLGMLEDLTEIQEVLLRGGAFC